MSDKTEMMMWGAFIFLSGFLCASLVFQNANIKTAVDKFTGYQASERQFADSNVTTIQLNSADAKFLNFMFKASKQEVSFCLYGYEANGTIIVTTINESIMLERNKASIVYVPCEHSLGIIHTHPSGTGQFSDMDMFSFGATNHMNKSVIAGIIYGDGKYLFYYYKDIGNRLNYTIV